MLSELKNIYKKLQNDYNGDIIESGSKEVKRLFKKVSTELKESDRGNKPLVNIIYNHFHGILPAPNYVSGPVTLSYQTSDKYGIKIYIFGEYHGNINNCDELYPNEKSSNLNISTYLEKVFENTDKFIDFYLEEQLFRSRSIIDYQDSRDFIDTLAIEFNNCINPDKREDCIFKTMRGHFIDTRNEEGGNDMLVETNFLEELINTLRLSDSIISHDIIADYFEFFDRMSMFNSYEDIAWYVISLADSIGIIGKEIDRCTLDRRLLFSHFAEVIAHYYSLSFDIQTVKNTMSIIFSAEGRDILLPILITIQAPIVDLYAITRIFKKFNKTNYFPTNPKYIIYYAGNGHSMIVRNFLEKLDFENHFYRSSNRENSTRCLDMSGIKLDFK